MNPITRSFIIFIFCTVCMISFHWKNKLYKELADDFNQYGIIVIYTNKAYADQGYEYSNRAVLSPERYELAVKMADKYDSSTNDENKNFEALAELNSLRYDIEIDKYKKTHKSYDYKALSKKCIENYMPNVLLELPFGKELNQIGVIKVTAAESGGLSGFDVDENKNIYIFDSGNKYLKIFNSFGELIKYFPVADNCHGMGIVSLDDDDNIWIHNWLDHIFYVYNIKDGKLIKSVRYPHGSGQEFSFRNNSLVGYFVRYNIPKESFEKGVNDEPVYMADVEELDPSQPSVWNSGKYSEKLYNYVEDYFPENRKNISQPKLKISEGQSTCEIIYDNIEPIYDQYRLLGEDKYKNYYIMYWTHKDGFKVHVYKYNNKNELIAIINDLPFPEGYFIREPIVVSECGDVYVMSFINNSVVISKYIKQEGCHHEFEKN
jgi:hypothetical protein